MDDTKQRSEQPDGATENTRPGHASGVVPETDKDQRPREIGGRKGPDPVRYGDWEKNGRCIDF